MALVMLILSLTLLISNSEWILTESNPSVEISKPSTAYQHVKLLDSQALEELKKSDFVSMIYYYTKDYSTFDKYFEEWEKSAKLLETYSVTLAVFNCTANSEENEKCIMKDKKQYVYVYQIGVELVSLELETLFDVDSIVGNALQLALLREIPIVQSPNERQVLERYYANRKDIIFAFTKAVGTHEHRIMMEIAYTFQDKYKFVISTEFTNAVGLQESDNIRHQSSGFAFWILFCSEASSAKEVNIHDGCRDVLYRGEVSLSDIVSFMKRLSEPTLFHAPKDGITSLFHLNELIPTVYLYTVELKTEKFEELIQILTVDLQGFGRLVVVDMNNNDCRFEAVKQGLEGKLPRLSIKIDMEITFMDSRQQFNLVNIEEFLFPLLFPHIERVPGKEDRDDSSNIPEESTDEVQIQDDPVAKAVFTSHSNELRSVEVPSLLKSSFNTVMRDSELKIVLFYLPFDTISMAFLLDFNNAWKTLVSEFPQKDILARVNCYDATDLCAIQNITTYPVLKIFKKGKIPQQYDGPLNAQAIVKAASLLMLNSPVVLGTEEEVERFVKGEFPQNISHVTSTSVLFVARPNDKDTLEAFDSASRQLSYLDMLGTVKENLLNFVSEKYQTTIPTVISFNRKDTIKPLKKLDSIEDASSIVSFVKDATIPIMPELSIANLPTLLARQLPFVILFMDATDPASAGVKEIVTQAGSMFGSAAIFCWMDAQINSLGSKLLSEYTWKATVPVVTYVDHSQGQIYNYETKHLIKKDFTDWLMNIFTGKQEPSMSLHEDKWLPLGECYDFLKMMDMEIQKIRSLEQEMFDKALKRAEESVASNPEDKEYLELENEIREELLQLRKSRNYQDSEIKQEKKVEEKKSGETTQRKKTETSAHGHAEL